MSRIVVVNKELLEQVASELGLGADVVEKTAYRAVNAVAAKNMTRSRREITAIVNLTPAYVRERMALRKANAGARVAVIAARRRPTTLKTYGTKQVARKDKGAKRGTGHNGGRLWGIHAGSGDPLRNIAAGSVPSGITVKELRKSSRQRLPGAFFMPLRAGKSDGGNGMGVFIRTGNGKRDLKHLYGLSVDQVFKNVIEQIAPDVESELEEALLRQARYEFAKALGRTA
jgi:hypothetical protein